MIVMQRNRRRTILKTILWGIVGIVIGVAAKGFLLGLGTIPQATSEGSPSWIKVTVIAGILAGAMLVLIFFLEKRGVYRHESRTNPEDRLPASRTESFDPLTLRSLLPNSLAAPRRYSLAALTAAATVIALLPQYVLLGAQPEPTPVSAARTMEGPAIDAAHAADHDLHSGPGEVQPVRESGGLRLMIVDGNREGRLAFFPHDDHVSSVGGKNPCAFCHHQNLPFDQNSSCWECHRDMYAVTDIFSHASHIEKLGENDGCTVCHQSRNGIKTRNTAAPCGECHADMLAKGSFVEPEKGGLKGYAVGYKEAMHGLCVTCHEEFDPDLTECTVCHRDRDGIYQRGMGPYVRRFIGREEHGRHQTLGP